MSARTKTEMTPGKLSRQAAERVQRSAQERASVLAPRRWKAPISLAFFTLVSALGFVWLTADREVRYYVSGKSDAIKIPDVTVDFRTFAIIGTVVLALLALYSAWRMWTVRHSPRWVVVVFAALFILLALGAIAPAREVGITYLLTGALALSVPLVFGAMAGVLSERAGVVNIAIEGQLLTGAFVGAVVGTMANHPMGLVAAVVAGGLVSMVLAAFSIKYLVDQVIVGVVLTALVIAVTNYLTAAWLVPGGQDVNFPRTLDALPIPLLSDIPVLGPLLFNHRITVYLMFLIVPLIWFVLFKTRWGLRLRAVGEYPLAADTVGIDVNATRFWWVTIGGMIAGLGGAAMTLGNAGSFVREMSAGQGYIALAAVILGRWHPLLATGAALMFGFATQVRIWAGGADAIVPSDLVAALPYLITLIAVAGFAGKVTGPAASGKPYVKE